MLQGNVKEGEVKKPTPDFTAAFRLRRIASVKEVSMPALSRPATLCAVLALLFCASGFVPQKTKEPTTAGRGLATLSGDQRIANTIKAKLLDKDKQKGLAVKVSCFDGRVYLVGRLDDTSFQNFAVTTARAADGVLSVEIYFLPETGDASADPEVADRVRAVLAADKAISAGRLEVEVVNGVAVLLGTVPDQAAAERVREAATAVPGVERVQSFLIPGR
jgi:osmotically-inducible protein OsmY